MWKIKYWTMATTALLIDSDSLWERAWVYGYTKSMGEAPPQNLIDDVFGRL